jgi:hypothetical protein
MLSNDNSPCTGSFARRGIPALTGLPPGRESNVLNFPIHLFRDVAARDRSALIKVRRLELTSTIGSREVARLGASDASRAGDGDPARAAFSRFDADASSVAMSAAGRAESD